MLLSCDYTVVFIGHEQEKNGFVTPKGDKRCLGPILDNCDFVVYVKANGVDEKGQLIKSSGYMVQTKEFFARSRFEHCPPVIKEFSAENLEKAINEAIENEEKLNNATIVSYAEQKAQNTSEVEDYDEVMNEIQAIGMKFVDAGLQNILTEIVEDTLGKGGKVAACSKRQIEALIIIRDNLREKAVEVNLK